MEEKTNRLLVQLGVKELNGVSACFQEVLFCYVWITVNIECP